MKKLARKIGVFILISLSLTFASGFQLANAQDKPESTTGTVSSESDDKDYCIKREGLDAKAIHVVLHEGLPTGAETPDGEVRQCVSVVECSLDLKTTAGQEKPVLTRNCQTNILRKCPNDKYTKTPDEFINAPLKAGDRVKMCTPVQVLVSWTGGAGLLQTLIGLIYKWAASIVGIIAVLMMVINGIIISASAGDTQAITNAKTRIMQSLVALVILFLSGLILATVNPNFFTSNTAAEIEQMKAQEKLEGEAKALAEQAAIKAKEAAAQQKLLEEKALEEYYNKSLEGVKNDFKDKATPKFPSLIEF